MSSRNAYRSLTISLTIIIVCTNTLTSGFTLRRTQNLSDPEPVADLAAEESTLLEVKYDLKRPNDIKVFEIGKTDEKHKVIAIENVKSKSTDFENVKTYVVTKAYEKLGALEGKLFDESPETITLKKDIEYLTSSPHITETLIEAKKEKMHEIEKDNVTKTTEIINQLKNSSSIGDVNKTTISPLAVSQSAPSLSTTSMQMNLYQKDTKSNTTQSSTLLITSTETKTFEDSPKATNIATNVSSVQYVNETQDLTSPLNMRYDNSTGNNSSYAIFSISNDNNNNSMVLSTEEIETRKDLARSIAEIGNLEITSVPNDEIETEIDNTISLPSAPINFMQSNNEISSTLDSISIVDTSPTTQTDVTKDTNSRIIIVDSTFASINPTSIPIDKEHENKTKNMLISASTDASWKEYMILDRKRVSTLNEEISTTQEKAEMTNTEPSPTRVGLEEAFSVTHISSLQQLRDDLIAISDQLSKNPDLSSTTMQTSDASEVELTTVTPISFKISKAKSGMVSSMRAGFLDYSGKSISLRTTTVENDKTVKDMSGTMYGIEAGYNDGIENKSGAESQSQLAEDAIKEELLREEMLSNHDENVKRYRDDRVEAEMVKPLAVEGKTTKDLSATSSQTNKNTETEDTLSVQPIGHEQGKNTDLYVVSPNYKPMKRIEVQPAKQFVRDPDDNSWRNESISSLGIVFKPKNSSKSFTQVLKNKTETELNTLSDRDNKYGVPDLRERLEKIAEVRKSKKKKINKFGDTIYSDYDSGESVNTSSVQSSSVVSSEIIPTSVTPLNSSSINYETIESHNTEKTIDKQETTEEIFKHEEHKYLTTEKPKKSFKIAEYYDTTDEYDADYLTFPKIELKKFTSPLKITEEPVTASPVNPYTQPMRNYSPDRKPTVQYFPPRVTQKVNVNDYDDNFQKKANFYTIMDPPKNPVTSFGTVSIVPVQTTNAEENRENAINSTQIPRYKPIMNKNLYFTDAPLLTMPHEGFAVNERNFNKASYIIKHYGDFINEAANDDDDRNQDFISFSETPVRGVTANELPKLTAKNNQPTVDDEYDYGLQFRKDILNRFVDNFNQNSERFKVDFPILYNNSVTHRKVQENSKPLASSTAFMKRLYNDVIDTKPNYLLVGKPCGPNCENITVELSPAYELHYYVPEQEEKEEVEPSSFTIPYRYRL